MSSERRHVNAARFVRDPRVAQLTDEQCAQFVKEKLGYSFSKSLLFVKQCRSSDRIGEMLERAADVPASSAYKMRPSVVSYSQGGAYEGKPFYSCSNGYDTTTPMRCVGGQALTQGQYNMVQKAASDIKNSYATAASTITSCCSTQDIPGRPGCALYDPCASFECPEAAAADAESCSRQLLTCTYPIAEDAIAITPFASEVGCEIRMDYPWVLLNFACEGRKQTHKKTGLIKMVACGRNVFKEYFDRMNCHFYNTFLKDTPYGCKPPVYCDQLVPGYDQTADADASQRFQERGIPNFARWCFGGDDVGQKVEQTMPRDAEPVACGIAPAEAPIPVTWNNSDRTSPSPMYAVAATHHDMAYTMEACASNLEEYVEYMMTAGLMADMNFWEIKEMAEAGGYWGAIDKDQIKSWENSTNAALREAYNYWFLRGSDYLYGATKQVMLAKAQLASYDGYDWACYDNMGNTFDRQCLESAVSDAEDDLYILRQKQKWRGYPQEMQLAFNCWKMAGQLSTHGECLNMPTFIFTMADDYHFECCQNAMLLEGMTEYMQKIMEFIHDAEMPGSDADKKMICIDCEAMANCLGVTGKQANIWKLNVVRTVRSVLMDMSKDGKFSSMLKDLSADNDAYAKSMRLDFSAEARKIASQDFLAMMTCFPGLCSLDEEPAADEQCRQVHVIPMTCADIAGANGHCTMLPMTGISGDIYVCGNYDAVAAINAVLGPQAAGADGCASGEGWAPSGAAGAAASAKVKTVAARVQGDLEHEQSAIQLTIDCIYNTLMNYSQSRTKQINCPTPIYQKPVSVVVTGETDTQKMLTPVEHINIRSATRKFRQNPRYTKTGTIPWEPTNPEATDDVNPAVTQQAKANQCYPTYILNDGVINDPPFHSDQAGIATVATKPDGVNQPYKYPSIKRSYNTASEDVYNLALQMATQFARNYSPWKVPTYDTNADKTGLKVKTVTGLPAPCSINKYVQDLIMFIDNMKVCHPLEGQPASVIKAQTQGFYVKNLPLPDATPTADQPNSPNLDSQFDLGYKYVKISDFVSYSVANYVMQSFTGLLNQTYDGDLVMVLKWLQGAGRDATNRNYYTGQPDRTTSDMRASCSAFQPLWDNKTMEDCSQDRINCMPSVCLQPDTCDNCYAPPAAIGGRKKPRVLSTYTPRQPGNPAH